MSTNVSLDITIRPQGFRSKIVSSEAKSRVWSHRNPSSGSLIAKVLDYNMVYSQGLPNDKKVG